VNGSRKSAFTAGRCRFPVPFFTEYVVVSGCAPVLYGSVRLRQYGLFGGGSDVTSGSGSAYDAVCRPRVEWLQTHRWGWSTARAAPEVPHTPQVGDVRE